MNYLCALIGLSVLVCCGLIVAALRWLARPPVCPACGSKQVDEYETHCICRTCGERWDLVKHFGSHGGSDL
jgi:hypothetical protein